METVKAGHNQRRKALEDEIAELETLAAEARSADDVDHHFALRLFEYLLAEKRKKLERLSKVRFIGH